MNLSGVPVLGAEHQGMPGVGAVMGVCAAGLLWEASPSGLGKGKEKLDVLRLRLLI